MNPKVIKIIAERPEWIPVDYMCFNASRPLAGDVMGQDEFIHGVFYAGVDPKGEHSKIYIETNVGLDAWLLEFVSQEEAIEEAIQWYKDNVPKVLERLNLNLDDQRIVEFLLQKFTDLQRDKTK